MTPIPDIRDIVDAEPNEHEALQNDLVNLWAEKQVLLDRIRAIDLDMANIRDILKVEFGEDVKL